MKKIEIKSREIPRNWGYLKVFDVYVNDVRVAVVDGGHVDLKSPTRLLSVSWDADGNPIYNASDGDYSAPFTMSNVIKDLIEKGEEARLYYVYGPGSVTPTSGPYLTWDEACRNRTCRLDRVIESPYNVTRDGRLV